MKKTLFFHFFNDFCQKFTIFATYIKYVRVWKLKI